MELERAVEQLQAKVFALHINSQNAYNFLNMDTPPSSAFLPRPDSKFWKVWCCDYVGIDQNYTQAAENPVYLNNSHEAAAYFIDSYLRAPAGQRISFSEMLKRMHQITARSLDKVPHAKYNPQGYEIDEFRRDTKDKTMKVGWGQPDNPFSIAFMNVIKDTKKVPKKAKLNVHFANQFMPDRKPSRLSFEVLPQNRTSYLVKITSVKPHWYQRVYCYDYGIKCSISTKREFNRFLKASGDTLDEIVKFDPLNAPLTEKRKIQLFKLVAKYYQLMLFCHPFKKQNNSMIVNQINCILFLYAGKFIIHSARLDVKAYAMSYEAFSKLFLQILEGLPTVQTPGIAPAPAPAPV